ncbi:MAG: hypothetical protein DLM73_09850 [Chthoniobacterales bacterium]|nr:MAG: hypothetical protein DLM73_09850 [Chthoniobacterales bacterium]
MKFFSLPLIALSLVCLTPQPARCARGPATLDDLKKIEIICFVPTWLPKGFKVKSVRITYDEPGPDDGGGRFPLYNIEWSNGPSRTGGEQTFSIDSAREGIGDRNLLDTDDSEDAEIPSPFGRMFIIYTPKDSSREKAKGDRPIRNPVSAIRNSSPGRKTEIKSNWTSDANMIREKAKDLLVHPTLGRYNGFSATGITVSDFLKIINSLRPIRP